jgi:hypothetical protein
VREAGIGAPLAVPEALQVDRDRAMVPREPGRYPGTGMRPLKPWIAAPLAPPLVEVVDAVAIDGPIEPGF